MKFLSSIALVACVASVAAVPTTSTHVLHEKREVPHKRWVKRDRVASHAEIPFRIGMTQSNLDKGYDLLMEVSDHQSPKYGQHYTEEEINELFAPKQEAVDSIRSWLESAGIAGHRISVSLNKQWIQFDGLIHEAEALFKTKYHLYEHLGSGVHQIACDEYHVPQHIQEHIDYITPGLKLISTRNQPRADRQISSNEKRDSETSLAKFPGPIRGPKITLPAGIVSKSLQLSMCDTAVGPACIQAMYNITPGTLSHPNNNLGIFEEGDFYATEDLKLFFATFHTPAIPLLTVPLNRGVDGGIPLNKVNIPVATGESDLDFQISYPIIHPQQSELFQTDDILYALGVEKSSGIFNTFLDAIDGSYCTYKAFGEKGDSKIDPKYPDPNPLGYQGKLQCGVYKAPTVISVSYGEQEDDLPTNYQRRQCSEFMKLGMRGTTVVFASGDSGVAARSTDDGNSNGCLGKNGTVFNPDFPASCPYLTAVGATFLPSGANYKTDSEIAVTRFPSGGGFSNIYPRPAYQDKTLENYFAHHNPDYPSYVTKYQNNPDESITKGGRYNRAGRGYPDLGAIGDNVIIFLDGTPQLIGGTSAAAPVFASIINRINNERLHAGKSSVGFVNPVLYAHPEAFHDITNGTNAGCGTKGFSCVKGWDPLTGLGTPDYPKLLRLFMGLK